MNSIKLDRKHTDGILILTLLAIFFFTSLPYLNEFPKVWMDEAWDSTTAYSFQSDGTFRNLALVSSAMGHQDEHFLQPRILSNLVIAPIFSFLGVGNVQGRLASVLMGALSVIGIYVVARKIGGFVFSSVCALVLIFDNSFFVVTRTIRPEIFVVALAIWALYFLMDAGVAFWGLFLAGLLIGTSLYAHPNSVLVLIALLIIALSQVKEGQYWQTFLAMTGGIAVGFLPFALYVFYQDGANHFQDFWLQIHQRAEMLTNMQSYFKNVFVPELERYDSYIFFPYRLPIFLVQVTAIGYAFHKRHDEYNQMFLIFILVHVLLFPLLISNKTSRYMTVMMPVVTILVMKMAWNMAHWSFDISLREVYAAISKLKRTTVLPLIPALVLFVNQLGGDFWAVLQSRNCSFPPFINQVRNLVPAGNKVWGPMTFWFGFYDYPYRTELTIKAYDEMNDFRPDYIILHDFEIWGNQMSVTKRPDPYYAKMEPVRALLSQLVSEKGILVGSVPNGCYGNVEIYKLGWK